MYKVRTLREYIWKRNWKEKSAEVSNKIISNVQVSANRFFKGIKLNQFGFFLEYSLKIDVWVVMQFCGCTLFLDLNSYDFILL